MLGEDEGIVVRSPVIVGVVNPYVQYTVCSHKYGRMKEVPRRYSDFDWLFHHLEMEFGNVG